MEGSFDEELTMHNDRIINIADQTVKGNDRWHAAFWIILFLVLAVSLQLFVPYPIDDDTAYHFSVGQLTKKHGILHSFPWTPFSWQADHYADKEFLFHVLFIPFGGLGFITAARVVGALAGALTLSALYFVLRAEKVRLAGIWVLLLLTCSEFVFRLALVRPHLLSITLTLILMWALARNRLPVAVIVAFLFPLSYVAFWQIPLILIAADGSARLLAGERVRWKPAITVLAGIAAGVALHPNTVNLLGINWIHMANVLIENAWGKKPEFENIAKEFSPYTIEKWGRYLIVVTFMAGSALVLGWRDRRKDAAPLAAAIAAVLFGLLTARSLRFVEYFAPLSVVALAITSRPIAKRWIAPALLGVSLLYVLIFGMEPFKIIASKTEYIEPRIAQYFAQTIPEGSQVFTCGWDYTGNLMLVLPERKFIVAADPTLFAKKDPELYRVWRRIPLDAPIDSVEAIRRLFKSRYVICLNYQAYWPFFDTLEKDPGVKTLIAEKRWVFFDLGEPPTR
jgi:hypothetical protein